MPLNERLLRIAVANQGEKVLVAKVRPLVELDFQVKKEAFLNEFDENPVTQEIEAGPNALSNIPALAETGGNLFSFLGFESNKNPIEWLRGYFNRNIVLGRTRAGKVQGRKIIFSTPVKFPTVNEVNSDVKNSPSTKLKWTTRAFTDILAKGVPGLPSFLFRQDPPLQSSRSGTGIQIKGKINGRPEIPEIPYINKLLTNLKVLFTSRR